jgi:hypothetical protein
MARVVDDLLDREGWDAGWEHVRSQQRKGQAPEPGVFRLSNLVNKHRIFRRAMVAPFPLAASRQVIRDEIKLTSLQIREPRPNGGAQALHIDWRPRRWATAPFGACASFLYLDDVTQNNGALRYVPRSHRILGEPTDYVDPMEPHPQEVVVEAGRGTMVCVNAHTWHGGTANPSGKRRRTLFITYRNRKHWQQLDQKRFLDPEVIASLSEPEAYLLGVRPEDPTQNDFFYERRNTWYVRAVMYGLDWLDAMRAASGDQMKTTSSRR